MTRIRIETGGRPPAEIEDCLLKAARSVGMSIEKPFNDLVMQQEYTEHRELFEQILDAMVEDVGALS